MKALILMTEQRGTAGALRHLLESKGYAVRIVMAEEWSNLDVLEEADVVAVENRGSVRLQTAAELVSEHYRKVGAGVLVYTSLTDFYGRGVDELFGLKTTGRSDASKKKVRGTPRRPTRSPVASE